MKYAASFFLTLFCSTSSPLSGWETEPEITLKGILKTATRQRMIRYPDGTEKKWEEKSTVLVPDVPITVSRSILIGTQPPMKQEESPLFIHLTLSDEFDSLIGKSVELHGHLTEPRVNFFFISDIEFRVNAAIDTEWQQTHPVKTVLYEPNITELKGTLYKKTYPGPPGYTSLEKGDTQENVLILALTEPVDVQLANEDEEEPFNQPEKGVREIHISFLDSEPSEKLWNQEITIRGTLFSAHTGHHRRRIVMLANAWESTDNSNLAAPKQ